MSDCRSFVILALLLLLVIYGIRSKTVENFMNMKPTEKQTIYRNILERTNMALDALNVPFFLSSGTCLGYVRERDFIDHDYDIDIGIHSKDYTPKIIDEMNKQGLYLYRVLGSYQKGLELSFYLPNVPAQRRAKIDIFVHNDNGSKTCWYSYNWNKTKKLQYCVSSFDTEEVDFLGLKVNIPSPSIQYLEEHYGKDWRIPKGSGVLGDYNYSSSPLSLVNNFQDDGEFWY